jgi:hypothetical protein
LTPGSNGATRLHWKGIFLTKLRKGVRKDIFTRKLVLSLQGGQQVRTIKLVLYHSPGGHSPGLVLRLRHALGPVLDRVLVSCVHVVVGEADQDVGSRLAGFVSLDTPRENSLTLQGTGKSV